MEGIDKAGSTSDGVFRRTVKLHIVYTQYKFVVDGNWTTNPTARTQNDQLGIVINFLLVEDITHILGFPGARHDLSIDSTEQDNDRQMASPESVIYSPIAVTVSNVAAPTPIDICLSAMGFAGRGPQSGFILKDEKSPKPLDQVSNVKTYRLLLLIVAASRLPNLIRSCRNPKTKAHATFSKFMTFWTCGCQ